jgi:hypothetical protein
MNLIKSLILASLLALGLFTSGAAHADDAAATSTFVAPVTQGHWKVGGSFGYSSYGSSDWAASISPSAEYFFIDRLSFGGGASGSWASQGYTSTALAPSLTYYFLVQNQFGYYLNQTVNFSSSNYGGNGQTYFGTTIGMNYFFTPSVAFGPSVLWTYGQNMTSSISVLGQFSVFF